MLNWGEKVCVGLHEGLERLLARLQIVYHGVCEDRLEGEVFVSVNAGLDNKVSDQGLYVA